jgi:hypothetical protein
VELSILIARILSVVYLSAALGALVSPGHYRRISDDIFNNAGLSYLAGFVAVIIGFLIIHYHNFWVGNWTVLITIVGWLALIKGILIIAVPQFVHRLSEMIFTGLGLRMFPYVGVLMDSYSDTLGL